MSVVAVSFLLRSKQYDALEKRAHAMGVKPSEYARQLYEAAFSARIADERGEESGDAMLDRMVKQTFLLAECEPDFIAKVIGASEEWVKAILDGWRAYAKDPAKATGGKSAPVVAAPSPQAVAMGEASGAAKRKPYSDADILTIRRMWAEGAGTEDIAVALGRPHEGVKTWVYSHPGICPSRRGRA